MKRFRLYVTHNLGSSVIRVADDYKSLSDYRIDNFKRFLDYYLRHPEFGIRNSEDLLNALIIEAFEEPSPKLIEQIVDHMLDKSCDWYLPRIYKNLDAFVSEFSYDQLVAFKAALIIAKDKLSYKRGMKPDFKSWCIMPHDFKINISRGGDKNVL